MNILLKFYLLFSTFLIAQFTGYVIDKDTGIGIENVNIILQNSGAVSDINGKFVLNVPPKTVVKFSHIGYKDKIINVTDNMIVEMEIIHLKQKEISIISGISGEFLENLHSSVTVFTLDDIKKTGNIHLQTLMDQISNLTWAGGTSRPRYFQIRGVGERSQYFGEGPPNFSIGFTVDEMDLSGLGMVGLNYDINQIEVLNGDQSTIFGANSIGGLIAIHSKNPTENFEVNTNIATGSDGLYTIGALINLPLRYFNIRISSFKNYSNGFRENIFKEVNDSNKRDEILNRVKINFKPNMRLNFLGTFLFVDQNNGYDVWAPDNNENYITYSDRIGKDAQITKGLSLKSTFQIASQLKLTSITTRTEVDLEHSYDGDWADSAYWHKNHNFDPIVEYYDYDFYDKTNRKRKTSTQELRISYKNLILGSYYKILQEKDNATGYLYGGIATDATSKFDLDTYATYLQYEYAFIKRITLKLNYRYEISTLKYKGETFDNYYFTAIPSVKSNLKFPMFGYSTVLSYANSPNSNFFSSYSRGYKSGGINQEPKLSSINRVYDPEYHDNIEFGCKFIRNQFRVQLNLFYNLRFNQQVSISSQQYIGDPNSFLFYIANAGSGKSSGLELKAGYQTNKFEVGADLGYLSTFVNEFVFDVSMDETVVGGNREAAMSPNLSGSIYFLGHINQHVYFRISSSYKSGYFFSDSHNEKSSKYFLTNISIGYKSNKYELSLWVNNFFNEIYETRGFYFGLIPPDFEEELFKSFGDPRQAGLTINYNF